MKVANSKTVDELAQESSKYQLVLTPYPSLADALNSRLENTEVTTPRKYCSEDEEFREKAFLELVNRKGLNWKKANHLLEAALSCWRNTGSIELEKHGFSEKDSEEIRKALEKYQSYLNTLENVSYPESTAVIFYSHMDEVEKQSLGGNFSSINVLLESKEELRNFYSYTSSGTLVQSLFENLNRLDPEKVGVAVSSDSKYRYLLESKLEAEGIPYKKRDSITDSQQFRTLISLLRISKSGKRAQVKDLKPILDQIGMDTYGDGQKFLDALEDDMKGFKDFFNTIRYLDFGEVIEGLEDFGYENVELEKILKDSGLWSAQVSPQNIRLLEHYGKRFTEDKKSEEGVILADPRRTAKIDRETVFFVGIEDKWEAEEPEYLWVSEEKEAKKRREALTSLIGSGDRRVFMVQEKEMGRPVRPAEPFVEAIDRNITSFSDLELTKARPENFQKGEGFEKESIEVETKNLDTISQSSLNNLVLSPRLYYFNEVLDDEDRLYLEKGQMFHDFAEFYVNYPGWVKEKGLDRFKEVFLEHLDPFIDDVDRSEIEKEVSLGLNSIMNLLDSAEIDGGSLEECESISSNHFAKALGKGLRMEVTELHFEDKEIGISGKIDLAVSDSEIVDFKSGRKKSKKKIALSSKVQSYTDQKWPDFQAPIYLSYLRKRDADKQLNFVYFHFLENLGEQVRGDIDIEDLRTKMVYYPESFDSFKSSKEVFENLKTGVSKSNDRRKTLEKMGYPAYEDFMKKATFPQVWNREKLEKTDFYKKFEKNAKQAVGDYTYVEKGVRTAVGKLLEIRIVNYYREDLNELEKFITRKINELEDYRKEGFPLNEEIQNLPEKDLLIE